MRLWTLHPSYLDTPGLTACWREGLLAQAVLLGRTTGYKNHPQLIRFKDAPEPLDAISSYLFHIHDEATRRNYSFDAARIVGRYDSSLKLPTTNHQLRYELMHLRLKLAYRSPTVYDSLWDVNFPDAHPLFEVFDGDVEPWERNRHTYSTEE